MRFLMLNWRDPKNPLAGGAERVTQGYLAGLAKRGHEVFWFTYDFPGALSVERIDGMQIVRGGNKGTAIFKAILWCRRQPPFDLVMDQHHGIPWFAPWWCKTNCVAYIHEVLGPIWNSFYSWPLNALGRWQERWTHWLYRSVPFWTASACTKEILHAHGVRDVTLIPYGVDIVALKQLEDKPLAEPLRLIVVSRLAPNKRINHAVLALRQLLEQGTKAQLTIVGSGVEEEKIRRLVTALGLDYAVKFAGALAEDKKNEALRHSHFLLHPSVREGWGLNVIEANAMGTPAIVYPVPGLIEATLHDQTGLVTQQETPEALAAAIESALHAPAKYQQYRVKAWERAKTFHWDKILPRACAWLENQAQRKR